MLGETFALADGSLLTAVPPRAVLLQGIPCRAGTTLTFHRNGQLASAELAVPLLLDGEALSAGDALQLDLYGHLRAFRTTLSAPRTFSVRGRREPCAVTLPPGTLVFVEAGHLRTATLVEPLTIDGFAFPAQTELVFGDSAALSHAHLPEAWFLQGVRWSPEEPVVFEFGFLREGYPDEDGTLDGVPYLRHEVVRFDDDGGLVRCYLRGDHELSGVPCRGETRVYLDGRGGLVEGTLSRDAVVDGIPVAEGSLVLARDGVVVEATPREEVLVDGVWCAPSAPLLRDPQRRLLRATLSRPQEILGVRAPPGSVRHRVEGRDAMLWMRDGAAPDGAPLPGEHAVLWDPSGRERARVRANAHSSPTQLGLTHTETIGGVEIASRTTALLASDGALREAVLARDQTLQGLPCAIHTRVRFDPDGRLCALTLARDALIGEVPCARGSTLRAVINDVERQLAESVVLHPDGTVAFATLSADATVAGAPLRARHTVARHANGALSLGTLARDLPLDDGRVAAVGTLFARFDDGTPSLLTLAQPHGPYAPGTTLEYSAPGVLRGAAPKQVPLGEMSLLDEVTPAPS